jgi:hypothetical protein
VEEYRLIFSFLVRFIILLDIIIGLITVTFINCSALCGAVILPFRKKAAFKWILSAFIGLGTEKIFILFVEYILIVLQLLEHLLEQEYFI